MFNDLSHASTWETHSHRGWSTLASFVVQATFVSGLLLLPLLYTQGLPRLRFMESGVLSPPPGPAPAPPRGRSTSELGNRRDQHLMTPAQIPNRIATFHDEELLPPEIGDRFSVPGGTAPLGERNTVPDGLGNASGYVPPPPKPVPNMPQMRVSHMMEGNLVHRVDPGYPPLARQARIQGSVVLRAVIDREGKITNLQLISGHPLLVQAAIDAVRQWRYRPYILNEQPIEVETQITVNFVLAGGG